MPDTSVTTVVTSIILPEYLLTLANHPNFGVRVAAIRLLFKYIQRTERVHPNGFRVEVIQGYELLATQLYNWGYSQVSPPLMDRIASSILSLIHGVEVYSTSRIPVSNPFFDAIIYQTRFHVKMTFFSGIAHLWCSSTKSRTSSTFSLTSGLGISGKSTRGNFSLLDCPRP